MPEKTLQNKLVGKYIQGPVSEELRESIENGGPALEATSKAYDFYGTQTYNPIFDHIWKTHQSQTGQWFGSAMRIAKYDGSNTIIEENIASAPVPARKTVDCFRKVIHLLNPIGILQDEYAISRSPGLPWYTRGSYAAFDKIQSYTNQAYIDCFASYLVSRLHEEKISPHFVPFYGGLTTITRKYLYNITYEYATYKKEPWFNKKISSGSFKVHLIDSSGAYITDPDVCDAVLNILTEANPADLADAALADPNAAVADISGAVTATAEPMEECDMSALEEIEDIEFDVAESSDESEEDDDDEDTDDDDATDDGESSTSTETEADKPDIYIEFNDMPSMMVFYEKQDGSFDDLLYDNDEVGANPGTVSWEERWCAWIFQIVIALAQLQAYYDMTHNDLHSCNILWIKTDKQYLFYKSDNKQIYKVPTFGKIFRIIDFGRAIFKVGRYNIISDDYDDGNDAHGQYNFGAIYDPDLDYVEPNRSFDLARLMAGCLDKLYPQFPKKRKNNPKKLSEEPGRTMWETTSSLFNLLWSWIVTDQGENILFDAKNNERYPNFELYVIIANHIHNAVPADQINAKPFQQYRHDKKVPASAVIYPIGC